MNRRTATKFVNENFVYVPDRKKHVLPDVWEVLQGERLEGDCEDYALTLLFLLEGPSWYQVFKALLTRKAGFHLLKDKETGEFHIQLEYEDLFIDNIIRKWNDGKQLSPLGFRSVKRLSLTWILFKLTVSWVCKSVFKVFK